MPVVLLLTKGGQTCETASLISDAVPDAYSPSRLFSCSPAPGAGSGFSRGRGRETFRLQRHPSAAVRSLQYRPLRRSTPKPSSRAVPPAACGIYGECYRPNRGIQRPTIAEPGRAVFSRISRDTFWANGLSSTTRVFWSRAKMRV